MSAGAGLGLDAQDGSLAWSAINAGCRLAAQVAVSAREESLEVNFSSMAIAE